MAFKRTISTPVYVDAYPSRRTRIKIPQPVTRPVDIHGQDLVKKGAKGTDPWWFTGHKRGIKRLNVGDDPLEVRATSKSQIRGTLPERILYKALIDIVHLVPGVDFDFQSSQEGGRQELGGIVADFLFYYMRIIIQVQGPTHTEFLRSRKDEEQREILTSMGYQVYDVEEYTIYNQALFEEWLRRIFNLNLGIGSGGVYMQNAGTGSLRNSEEEDSKESWEDDLTTQALFQDILNVIMEIKDSIYAN
jgi:hypothetical protein